MRFGVYLTCLTASATALAACSSSESSGPSGVPNQVNVCATKGAMYLSQFKERPGGTCGAQTDQLGSIDDPRITSAFCESVSQANCVERASNCKAVANGCEYTETYVTTFAADGSSATSVDSASMRCSDGYSCFSTYDVVITRQ